MQAKLFSPGISIYKHYQTWLKLLSGCVLQSIIFLVMHRSGEKISILLRNSGSIDYTVTIPFITPLIQAIVIYKALRRHHMATPIIYRIPHAHLYAILFSCLLLSCIQLLVVTSFLLSAPNSHLRNISS